MNEKLTDKQREQGLRYLESTVASPSFKVLANDNETLTKSISDQIFFDQDNGKASIYTELGRAVEIDDLAEGYTKNFANHIVRSPLIAITNYAQLTQEQKSEFKTENESLASLLERALNTRNILDETNAYAENYIVAPTGKGMQQKMTSNQQFKQWVQTNGAETILRRVQSLGDQDPNSPEFQKAYEEYQALYKDALSRGEGFADQFDKWTTLMNTLNNMMIK